MKIALDEWCFHNSFLTKKMTMEDFFARAGELRVDGVGFDYFMLPGHLREHPDELKSLLDAAGLEAVFGFGAPFALPDIAQELLGGKKDDMFDVAGVIGAKVLRVCGGVILPNMFGKPIHVSILKKREIEEVARRLKVFAADAALEGLTVAIENHSEYTADEMLEILERAESDNLKVTLDTGNALYLGEDPAETARRLAPHAAYTHIKNLKKVGPLTLGTGLEDGDIDVAEIVSILKESGYEGMYSVEVALPLWRVDDEAAATAGSVEFLRGL